VSKGLDAEVIVVGGGPSGASTAWALAREGVDVLVLDKAKFPRDKICAEYLSPQASRILSDMGVLDEIERSNPGHLAGMSVRAPNGFVANGEFASNHGFHGFRDKGLAVRRTILDDIVLRGARTAGARVEESVRVTDVARNGGERVLRCRRRRAAIRRWTAAWPRENESHLAPANCASRALQERPGRH
jgi:flavin-dependent dehydrogenase